MSVSARNSIVFSTISFILMAVAVIAPRSFSDDFGLAAAGSAAITFLAFALLALVMALIAAVYTFRKRADLSIPFKLIGFAPLIFLIAMVATAPFRAG